MVVVLIDYSLSRKCSKRLAVEKVDNGAQKT